jgi:hypothetical protein
MERLFCPCTRLWDLWESRGHVPLLHDYELQELNLDVSTEELLSAERGFTYADLYAMFANEDTVVWLTPHAAVTHLGGYGVLFLEDLADSRSFSFNADGKEIVAWARTHEHLLEICDIILRLLAASVVYSVHLKNRTPIAHALINAPTLTYLMEQ